mmetsp:Transcript_10887/g.25979  ORF Transcript_10887/g.25979 Transcript_10887/m.25979 type:complete len:425 (+) Transcript_10887:84-1358(+)
MTSKTTYLLTGDIGGTNSRMGLYSTGDNIPLMVKTFRNLECLPKKETGIFQTNIIIPFLEECWSTVRHIEPIESSNIVASLAVAGPVRNNKVSMSNLHGIVIDGDAITNADNNPYLKSIKVCTIINDFVAQGYGCLTLTPKEVIELTPGSLKMIDPTGPKACVGAGTGLGECFLTPSSDGNDGGVYSCFPSEGGHVEWAPRTDLEVKMWKFLKDKFGHKKRISVERIVSGTGLANVYEFLASEFPNKIDPNVHKEFLEAGDLQGKVVATSAKSCELCELAMETMITSYGAEVGCVGIKFFPTGGLYVTGGLTPKNIDWITGKNCKGGFSYFLDAYRDKGRVSPILDNVPLLAVLTEDLGVRGAVKSAQLEYEKFQARSGDSIVTASEKYEKDADKYKRLFQLSVAFSLGALVGIHVLSSRPSRP